MRVCVELKFDRQYSAVFSRKYIKIKIEFEKPYLLCVCCVYRFSELLEAVLGDFLLNGRCNGMLRTKDRPKRPPEARKSDKNTANAQQERFFKL